MSILMIGTEQEDIYQLKYYLHSMDLSNILHFGSVEMAMNQLTDLMKAKVDVILVDTLCTYANREEVYGEIAVLRNWIQAPIILVTTYDTRETIEGAFFAGIFDFMLKPVDFSYFKARLHIAIKFNYETRKRVMQDDNLKQDLLIARNVQKSALTPSLNLDWLQIDGFNRMSHTLGGDMYCWAKVSQHSVAVVLYDVMGHGVASALVSMSIRSLLREIMTHLADPVMVIQELNRHVYELFEDEQMDNFLVTAIYMVIDQRKGKVEYVNASHPAGFLFSEKQTYTLTANAPILGLIPKLNLRKETIRLEGHYRIVLYTDGLQQEIARFDQNQFVPYLADDNRQALQRYVKEHDLDKQQTKDDISLVFITI